MPIVSTNAVSKEISSMTFYSNDTLVVTLAVSSSDGVSTTESHTLQAAAVSELLDTAPAEGYTMRQAIIFKVYATLLALGLVHGEIAAG